jgi:hypothetical protein
MNHHGHSRRTQVVTADGRQRWDKAYQNSLAWSQLPAQPTQDPRIQDVGEGQDAQEVAHARSGLCTRLDAEPGACSDD